MTTERNTVNVGVPGDRPGLLKRIGQWYSRFASDRRGGTAVQAIAFMPVILLTFMMGMKMWQVFMIRRSLHTGVHLATRYLSLYPPDTAINQTWSLVAREFVVAELKNNPFTDRVLLNSGNPTFEVEVELLDQGYACKDNFTVRAKYPVFNMRPSDSQFQYVLPNLNTIYLREQRLGEVLCD